MTPKTLLPIYPTVPGSSALIAQAAAEGEREEPSAHVRVRE